MLILTSLVIRFEVDLWNIKNNVLLNFNEDMLGSLYSFGFLQDFPKYKKFKSMKNSIFNCSIFVYDSFFINSQSGETIKNVLIFTILVKTYIKNLTCVDRFYIIFPLHNHFQETINIILFIFFEKTMQIKIESLLFLLFSWYKLGSTTGLTRLENKFEMKVKSDLTRVQNWSVI